MKKILLITILLMIPLALAIQTETSEDNVIRIDFLRSTPSPLSTGSEGELIFQVTNLHTKTLSNLEFEIVDKFPITAMQRKITIERINPEQTIQFSFKVKTAKGVEDGIYTIGLQYKQLLFKNNKISSAQFTIPIKTTSRAIASTLITTKPEKISPGSKAKIFIDLQNGATYAMKDVVIKLNFSDTVPIAPISSTSEKSIKLLNPSESKQVDFDVIALPGATPNVYRLPITITFDDELGTENTKRDYVGLIITSDPEYDLGIEDSSLIKGVTSKATISISNIGPSNIKYLTLEVVSTKEYLPIKQTKEYIGNLEPDDFETAEFSIYPKKSGEVNLNIKLKYKDDLNQPVEELKELKVQVYSQREAKRFGLIKKSGLSTLIFYILVIIFIYLTYKNWRKERNISKAMKLAGKRMLIALLNLIRATKPRNLKRLPRKIRIAIIKLK